MSSTFIPKDYQPAFPMKDRVSTDIPQGEKMEFDALFVGAGPASLSAAIRLSQLCEGSLNIAVVEKAGRLGGHSLSGSVVNPIAFKTLFPDKEEKDLPFREKVKKEKMYLLTKNKSFRIPLPPTMKNKNFYTASLCEIVRFLGQQAETKGIHIFPSTSADKLIIKDGVVCGITTTPIGLDRKGQALSQHQPAFNILAKTTFLGDGVRGHLSQSYLRFKNISSHYPSHYALGIKEIWKVKKSPDSIMHTVGFPLKNFGGSWMYPLSNNEISIGLVSTLDFKHNNWDLNHQFQQMKKHPLFASILEGGECLEWGAKAIPEGGYHAIPNELEGEGVFILGDAAGVVHVPSLKGIHYAMLSGIVAAEHLHEKMNKKTTTSFSQKIKSHPQIGKDLFKVRNVVQTLQVYPSIQGFIRAGLMILTRGLFPGNLSTHLLKSDNEKQRVDTPSAIKNNKGDQVYLSGNKTRDDIPSHLIASKDLPSSVQNFYVHLCPSGVYEINDEGLVINSPNCIDCKATDILGPWWSPREGGSGPDYTLM